MAGITEAERVMPTVGGSTTYARSEVAGPSTEHLAIASLSRLVPVAVVVAVPTPSVRVMFPGGGAAAKATVVFSRPFVRRSSAQVAEVAPLAHAEGKVRAGRIVTRFADTRGLPVQRGVIFGGHRLKVLDSVIVDVPVDVMDVPTLRDGSVHGFPN